MAARKYDYGKLSAKVAGALAKEFSNGDLVELTEGYLGRVHALIVSSKLNGMTDSSKQNYVWERLKAELGRDAQGVSVVMAYGTDELW